MGEGFGLLGEGSVIYLAGRIKNAPNYHEQFAKAADKLRAQGHKVYNPAAMNFEKTPIHKIMAHHLPQLCECKAIAMQRGWWRSGGARIEWLLARYLKLRIIYL